MLLAAASGCAPMHETRSERITHREPVEKVHLELPSGAISEATSNEHGVARFEIPTETWDAHPGRLDVSVRVGHAVVGRASLTRKETP